ncbi:MAG TPA: IS110 family transposase [Burkholderiales bacterium]|nr:IS110 family transposase [Burkholderiales bacterium]
MDLIPLHERVVALDIHQAVITSCAIVADADGVRIEERAFETFKRGLRALVDWCLKIAPEVVVMESTGIYWKSAHAWLERAGFKCVVVNAHHVKNVPGHKSDISDPRWLAMLARAGLLRPSFVPPEKLRFLRIVSRQRQKVVGMLAAEKNRLGKVLSDAGVRLGVVVSDINGKSARAMTAALIAGATPEEALGFASPRLKAPRADIAAALEGEISAEHAFVLQEIRSHIAFLERSMAKFDARLLAGLDSPEEKNALALLQTVPGIDRIGAAMLLVEIGTNMVLFAGADHLASWAGMCPGNNRSAGKRKNERQRKGNTYVRRLLCEFVQAARKSPCAFQAKHKALVIRRGFKRAIMACAHKMLRVIWAMLLRNEPYRDSTVDYEALSVRRNAPRWIRALKHFGYLRPSAATR